MRFGIIGSGAIGAYYGARLAKAGEDYADRMLNMTRKMKPYSPSMKVDFDHRRPMEIYYLYSRPIAAAQAHGFEMRRMRMLEEQLLFIQQTYISEH